MNVRRGLVVTFALLALGACASAPDRVAPRLAMPDRLTVGPLPASTAGTRDAAGRAQSLAGDRLPCAAWWRAFGDARVDALVERALANNPTITQAQAQLRQAHEMAAAQSAGRWPTIDLGASIARTHGRNAALVDNSAPGARTALLSASWSPDLFGALAHSIESSRAQEEAARWTLASSRLALAGAVIDALAAEEAAAQGERLLGQLVAIDERTLEIVTARNALGDVPMLAVWAQRQQVHDRQAAQAAARLQTAHAQTLLAALVGSLPADVAPPGLPLAITLPDIPANLDGGAILRRPDVQAADAQFRAADAARAAALSARFPQIALTAQTGYGVGVVGELLNPANALWDVGASVTQSVLDAGARRHQAEAARAAADAQAALYRATVLAAFRNVADALETARRDAEADVEATERTEAARRQWEIAERGEPMGATSHQDVLAFESAYLQNRLLQDQARAARLADTADAFVALGGGVDDGRCTASPAP